MYNFLKRLIGTTEIPPEVPKFVQDFELKRLAKMMAAENELAESPTFRTDEDVEWFKSHLSTATGLVEFGAGGSTLLAAKLGKPFISIESHSEFHEKIRQKIEEKGLLDEENQFFIHRSIGKTRAWGKPYGVGPFSSERKQQFRAFSNFPNEFINRIGPKPLVLIDGRFRLASALKSIGPALVEREGMIIIDDYRGRKFYHDVEKFAQITDRSGRMICLSRAKSAPEADLKKRIEIAELDWR